jgi:hypothetical protein
MYICALKSTVLIGKAKKCSCTFLASSRPSTQQHPTGHYYHRSVIICFFPPFFFFFFGEATVSQPRFPSLSLSLSLLYENFRLALQCANNKVRLSPTNINSAHAGGAAVAARNPMIESGAHGRSTHPECYARPTNASRAALLQLVALHYPYYPPRSAPTTARHMTMRQTRQTQRTWMPLGPTIIPARTTTLIT